MAQGDLKQRAKRYRPTEDIVDENRLYEDLEPLINKKRKQQDMDFENTYLKGSRSQGPDRQNLEEYIQVMCISLKHGPKGLLPFNVLRRVLERAHADYDIYKNRKKDINLVIRDNANTWKLMCSHMRSLIKSDLVKDIAEKGLRNLVEHMRKRWTAENLWPPKDVSENTIAPMSPAKSFLVESSSDEDPNDGKSEDCAKFKFVDLFRKYASEECTGDTKKTYGESVNASGARFAVSNDDDSLSQPSSQNSIVLGDLQRGQQKSHALLNRALQKKKLNNKRSTKNLKRPAATKAAGPKKAKVEKCNRDKCYYLRIPNENGGHDCTKFGWLDSSPTQAKRRAVQALQKFNEAPR